MYVRFVLLLFREKGDEDPECVRRWAGPCRSTDREGERTHRTEGLEGVGSNP